MKLDGTERTEKMSVAASRHESFAAAGYCDVIVASGYHDEKMNASSWHSNNTC